MPRKSVWKIVKIIKMDCEEWGGEPQIDETSLYRHVREMLDLERKDILAIEVGDETAPRHLGTEEEIRTAAD
jgi:hypothetical protein